MFCNGPANENIDKKIQKPIVRPRVRQFLDPQQRRQKFCLKWKDFPWLRPSERDSSVGFCTVCRRDLVCKRTHLERHQKTFKHTRLQGFESVNYFNEPEADLIEAHTSGYLDNDNTDNVEYEDEIMFDDEHFEYTTIKVEPAKFTPYKEVEPIKLKKAPIKLPKSEKSTFQFSTPDRIEQNISTKTHSIKKEQERLREMSDFFYMPRQQPKDSFDLFFESAAASVKSLPPKLAAELKSRVSQLLSEFELRAICEKEAQEKAAASAGTQSITAITSPMTVAVDRTICSSTEQTSVAANQQLQDQQPIAHYVYSYQPK
ncbi:ravus isoform X2 [Musca autumnalis]|uniref:ravus isoform X2 n=1 Tax=Musca autumnalis TaxID=221902 RepID=UPI003CEEC15F